MRNIIIPVHNLYALHNTFYLNIIISSSINKLHFLQGF